MRECLADKRSGVRHSVVILGMRPEASQRTEIKPEIKPRNRAVPGLGKRRYRSGFRPPAAARLPDFAAVLLDHAGRILVVSESDEL